MSTALENVLANVTVDGTERASVLYAKGRYAIDAHCEKTAKSNAAYAKTMGLKLRQEMVLALDGKVYPDKKHGRMVTFGDGSKAKY